MKEILEKAGYEIIEAGDGEDSIRIFNQHKDRLHLLILDVVMPKKNGKEVYDEIKKAKPDVKVVFVSGYSADIIHKKGIMEEGMEFISKPILPGDFLAKVRDVLDT
jgi:DNA-binding response OmpR family regulator